MRLATFATFLLLGCLTTRAGAHQESPEAELTRAAARYIVATLPVHAVIALDTTSDSPRAAPPTASGAALPRGPSPG